MKNKNHRKHPVLVWMIAVLAMTNLALILEASRLGELIYPSASATNGAMVSSGNPTSYIASMAATIGSGLVILGAAVVWVFRFAKRLVKEPSASVQTASKYATKTTKKDVKNMPSKLEKTVKKVARDIKADAKKAEAGAKKTGKKLAKDAKSKASQVKKGAKQVGKEIKSGAKNVGKAVKSATKKR